MNILVTGANGFIGTHICNELKKNNNVIGLGLHDCSIDGIEYHKIDILDKDKINTLFEKYKFDRVIHLASVTYHDDIVNKKQMSLEISMKGTEILVNAFNKYCSNSLFIFSSSGKIYGGGISQPIDEKTPPMPMNTLGKLKRITEEVIDYYSEDNKTNRFVVLRIFNIYGYGQRPTFVVPFIMQQLKSSDVLSLGNLDDRRDYLNIEDLTNCFVKFVTEYKSERTIDFFNVGSGKAFSVRDILSIIEAKTGRHFVINVNKEKLRHDETDIEFADISKVSRLLGWEPNISLDSGLDDILEKESLKF